LRSLPSLAVLGGAIACIGAPLPSAHAEDLYRPGSWTALASDRVALAAGDSLTVLIYETSSATNAAQNGAKRDSDITGQISAGSSFNERAQLGIGSNFDSAGQTGRSGRMVAQLSVVVEEVLANGDLRVAGAQSLKINGETTLIKLRGRVRPADISPGNAILSTRIADAEIDYDGKGFVSRSAKPGLIARIFNLLGL